MSKHRQNLWLYVAIGLTAMTAASAAWSASNDGRIVRSPELIESWQVHGISLNMSPQAAFETLIDAGFQAGTLTRFADWRDDGIEFVRGEYGSPAGYISLNFVRSGNRITSIGETFNAPGSPIDAPAAINRLKQHFGIAGEARRCSSDNAHRGLCEVQDNDTDGEIRHVLTYQILTTMRLVSVRRRE